MKNYDDDLNLKGHIIDKHSYGGWTVRVQTLKQGEIDTMSSFDLNKIHEWLHENHPDSVEVFVQQ